MKRLVAFLILNAALHGEGRQLPENYQTLDGLAKLTGLISQKDVVSAISEASAVLIYEGLPHPVFEEAMFFREAQRDDIVWFHDIPFYAVAVELKKEDRDAVGSFLKAPFPPLDAAEGPAVKMCGGFHPDFCVMIERKSGGSVGLMFCFTCADMIAFTERAYWMQRLDRNPARMALSKVLFRYARLRPKEEKPGPTAGKGMPPPTMLDLPLPDGKGWSDDCR